MWLIDGKNYSPYSTAVNLTFDLAAGVEGAQVWPYTVRFAGQEGGQLKWATGDLFTEPWNPVAGSNWAWDQAVIRATTSGDTHGPNTPQRRAMRHLKGPMVLGCTQLRSLP